MRLGDAVLAGALRSPGQLRVGDVARCRHPCAGGQDAGRLVANELVQVRAGLEHRLGQVDQSAGHRTAHEVHEHEAAQAARLLDRVAHVVAQLLRLALHVALARQVLAGQRVAYLARVHVDGALARVAGHEGGQHPGGVLAEPGDTLALQLAVHHVARALGQGDVVLVGLGLVGAGELGEQRHGLGAHTLEHRILLRVHHALLHAAGRVLALQLGRGDVRLPAGLEHLEVLHLAVLALYGHREAPEAHGGHVACLLQELGLLLHGAEPVELAGSLAQAGRARRLHHVVALLGLDILGQRGGGAQFIVLGLDELLDRGHRVGQVHVLHLLDVHALLGAHLGRIGLRQPLHAGVHRRARLVVHLDLARRHVEDDSQAVVVVAGGLHALLALDVGEQRLGHHAQVLLLLLAALDHGLQGVAHAVDAHQDGRRLALGLDGVMGGVVGLLHEAVEHALEVGVLRCLVVLGADSTVPQAHAAQGLGGGLQGVGCLAQGVGAGKADVRVAAIERAAVAGGALDLRRIESNVRLGFEVLTDAFFLDHAVESGGLDGVSKFAFVHKLPHGRGAVAVTIA